MDSADSRKYPRIPQPDSHADLNPNRTEDKQGRPAAGSKLTDDIDDLRRKMAETFLKEASFTADPVIMISRQLDLKINEYMKLWTLRRKQVR
ncbi:Spo0E family sporulation regulatory protein-aspartic acid phosphatase [Cohnella sp. CFH 77786]|uniref:aspartyl-phosphate phosphatase Spo0E family protein n=1 Tax=Cohnella sp. CFH 77786 TaxID=2662265 RepID=UPI001C6085FA|nr:aspartyl-phosphate phosphatase Spo0E family protein [Cohnella sp. CFH 77786]MBW5446944.1 Spo0E family sporulation regulatory protein-aspartic acid phosphatase [Cohnella sp. CFH 77786]